MSRVPAVHLSNSNMLTRRSLLNLASASTLGGLIPSFVTANAVTDVKQVSPLATLTASEMARVILNGEASSVEIVQACLGRIATVNPALNAVVQLREEAALTDAAGADKALAVGTSLGVLHGVPFTMKDSFDTKDLVSTAGTPGRAKYFPNRDATVVKRLRNAGGILLGKTNTPELTLSGETDNRVYGRTNNPLDLARTPGGSSGGAAAIIAAMGSPLDIGTDTGGSIRWPAHCCGIHGFKPTSGRVPRTGHIVSFLGDLQYLTQPGPLARSVEDLELIMRVIAGEDNIDPHIITRPFEGLHDLKAGGLRVAYHPDNGIMTPAPDIAQLLTRVVEALEDDGANVTEIRPSEITSAHRLMLEIVLSDISWVKNILAESGTTDSELPQVLADIGGSLDVRPKSRLMEEWDRYRSWMLRFMQDYDVIVCPVAPITAPLHGDFTMNTGSYLTPYNLAGAPAASITVGTSDENLPINIQIVGKPWADALVLKVAKFLEREFPVPNLSIT